MTADPLLLFPDFALILLGALLVRIPGFQPEFWRGLERLVYYVLLPPLLFNAIARAHFAIGEAGPALAAAAIAFLSGAALGIGAGPVLRAPRTLYLSTAQTAFRFNSYLGLALATTLFGPTGLAAMALIVTFAVPAGNVLAVSLLARLQHAGRRGVFAELAANPLILGTLAGIACNVAAIGVPATVGIALDRLAGAGLATGLLCIGAGLQFRRDHVRGALLPWLSVVKLLVTPAVAVGAALLLRLDALHAQVLLLFAALPTASASYILASRMGGDGAAVAFVITTQTLAAMATLPLWVAVAPRLLGLAG